MSPQEQQKAEGNGMLSECCGWSTTCRFYTCMLLSAPGEMDLENQAVVLILNQACELIQNSEPSPSGLGAIILEPPTN